MKIDWIAAIIGLLVGLVVALFTSSSTGGVAFFTLFPIVSGIVSVILANDVNYKEGIITGILSVIVVGVPLILLAGAGLFILLMGVFGGFLGVLINKYIFKSKTSEDTNLSRVAPIKIWWDNQSNGIIKFFVILAVIIVGVGLIVSIVGQTANMAKYKNDTSQTSQTNKTSVSTSNVTPTSVVDSNVQAAVLIGVKSFFKDFNAMYDEDGTSTGYIIDTINIDSISKVSDTEVQVTVSCKRIASNGNQFDSTWSGKFIKKNGKWVDDGNFVQTYSYNKNTGERVI